MRLLAVLAVLLGLLGMHGLASSHHAAASPGVDHGAASVVERPGTALGHQHAALQHDAAGPVAGQQDAAGPGALIARSVPSCESGCQSAAALCVAVLASAALALLLARQRRGVPLRAPARPPATSALPPVRHARGPDPVRELCVSRT